MDKKLEFLPVQFLVFKDGFEVGRIEEYEEWAYSSYDGKGGECFSVAELAEIEKFLRDLNKRG